MPRRPYVYDPRTGRYRDKATGRLVSRLQVRAQIDRALGQASREAAAVADRLVAGRISLAAAELEMRRLIKDVHLYSAASSAGGWDRLSPADLGRVGQRVRAEYEMLRARMNAVASGASPLDGRLRNSFRQFAQAGRATHHAVLAAEMAMRGFSERRSIRYPGDSCGTCVEMERLGWMSADDPRWIPIGSRECHRNCRCGEEWRHPDTGEVFEGGPARAAA
jgi:hypothetical protein